MNNDFAVLVDSVVSDDEPFLPTVPPAVYIDGVTQAILTDIDTIAVVGAVMLLRVRPSVRGRIRGRHAVPRYGACTGPEDKAHHTKGTGHGR